MKAIEFEATASQHIIRVPDQVPEGVAVRVLILFDKVSNASDGATRPRSMRT